MRLIISALYVIIFTSAISQDTLKAMYYNVLNYPGSTSGRVEYFRTITHYVMPDVILINELISDAGAELLLNIGLNTWGVQKYQKALFTDGPDTDNMLFFNSEKLTLYSQDTIPTLLRFINEYVLYYNSPELAAGADTVFLHFYSAHLKASNTTTDRIKRRDEVMAFKNHIAAKGYPENIFFGGDMNFYSAFTEPGYDSLVNSQVYSLVDPLPAGNWHDNPDFAYLQTQSTRTSQFGGGATGGMDDRFDFIFFSHDVINGLNGATYIPESIVSFGNDGNRLNLSLLDPPANLSIPDSVIQALYYMSDHLPVLCQIEISQTNDDTAMLDLKVFLEGAFDGVSMTSELADSFPINQPYDQAPWFLNETASANSVNLTDVVDWCIVELRITDGDAIAAVSVLPSSAHAYLIMNDGSIIDPNTGTLPLLFDTIPGNKFIAIRHRNHLDVLSAFPLVQIDSIYAYDFTTSASKVLGNNSGYSELLPGIWGMTAGDADGNGVIDHMDIIAKWRSQAGRMGYFSADFNLDQQVNNLDKIRFFLQNLYKSSSLSY
ncbi:MAG: hypothetical protein ACNA7V_07060 [Bacteroidales bacterium]